jgi:hypothetical protein
VAGCDETADTAVAGSVVPTIPDATYTRVATRESALAAGLDPGVVDDILGPDGELTIVYRFDNGRWAASGNFNGGDAVEVGDGGTYAFDDSGRLVTTSQSGGCHGCVGVIEWTLADRVLTMKLVPFDGQPRPYQDDEILMTDGEYQSDQ